MTIEPINTENALHFSSSYYINGWIAISGKFYITEDVLYFKHGKFNIGYVTDVKINICDVIGYKKISTNNLRIYLSNGLSAKFKFIIGRRNKVINAIEERRRTYFEKRNQLVPLLQLM